MRLESPRTLSSVSDDRQKNRNMRHLRLCLLFLLITPLFAMGQFLELNGGYVHASGDSGLDGYNVGASAWLSRRVSVGFDYDDTYDNTHLGAFELTQTGTIITKSHLQNFLVGPRIYFPRVSLGKEQHIARLLPFAEVEIGMSHLRSSLDVPASGASQSASDNAFSWMVGGGADYRFSPHWAGRVKLDLLRTHFSDTGQSRARIVIGFMYSFRRMIPTEVEQAAEVKRKAEADQAANQAAKEARKKAAVQEAERERLAAEDAAEAYRKAKVELAGAEARKKAAMEHAAPAEAPEAKNNSEVEHAAAAGRNEGRNEAMQQTEREKAEVRARLLEHLNRVLPTTDTPRGLAVDMSEVLFDTGKSDLQPEAREDLAKLSGIVLNYPSLKLTVEGHTDNTGSAESNQNLSEQRANAVRDYLVKQGLNSSSVTAQGLGENTPVADNSTAEGREKNRRIEIIVSGEVIGTKIGSK
jgi:outer membrane protein OmpA-like peptidoglycan-associated protein/opacity protein-like surface antigen